MMGMCSASLTLSFDVQTIKEKTMPKNNRLMDNIRQLEREQRQCFYHDPLEDWLEDHPLLAAIVFCAIVYTLVVLSLAI